MDKIASQALPLKEKTRRHRISAERKAEVATREEARKAILKSLELNMLKGGWDSDDKDAYLEVASLEVAAKEAHEGRSLSHANMIISKLGGKTFSVPRYEALQSIDKGELGGRIRKFDELKKYICQGMPKQTFAINYIVLEHYVCYDVIY